MSDRSHHRPGILKILAAAIALSIFSISAAVAKEKEDEITTENRSEEIIVTARKTAENIQDVPLSMTVMDQNMIEDLGIQSLADLADFIPNLTLVSNGVSGMNSPSVRGMHGFVESLTLSTGLFVDGVPILASTGFDDALLDIERIEVLRGPQGTLYGKNTESGAINIITRKPDNDFRGKVAAELGQGHKAQTSFSLSGPLQEDKWYFGVAGQYYEKEGYIDNTYTGETENDKKHWYGKGQLRWTPTDDLDISLIATSLRYDDKGNDMGLADLGAAMFGVSASGDCQVAGNFPSTNQSRTNAQSLKIAYDISKAMTLTAISTRRIFNDIGTNDWDFNPVSIMHADKDSKYGRLSQEVRLDSASDRLKWLVGVYFDREDNDIYFTLDSIVPTIVQTMERSISGDSWAGFGQATWSVADRLRLTGGLRYETQTLELSDPSSSLREEHSWDGISPKLSLDWDLTQDIMTYTSVSQGYRSGRFNTYATDPGYLTFDEETLWTYEIGLKSQWLNRRVSVNTALFYMDIDDMQVYEAVSATESYVTNAAKASGLGAEVEAWARIFKGVSLNANFGWSRVEFDQFEDAGGNYQGNKSPFSPSYTYSIGAQYRSPAGICARADLVGYGDMYFDKANQYKKPGYEVVNVKLGYEADRFDIYLYGTNIFDREHNAYGFSDGLYTIYSQPREIGLRLVFRI